MAVTAYGVELGLHGFQDSVPDISLQGSRYSGVSYGALDNDGSCVKTLDMLR